MNACKTLLCLALLGLGLAGCSSGGGADEPVTPPDLNPSRIPINLSCTVNGPADSRATDTGFEAGDRIGLYVVNYVDGRPASLQPAGNHADNRRFSYNGAWTPDSPLYWADEETKADFYLYYPYALVDDVHAHAFSLPADQSTEDAYKSADFLWGKRSGVSPTEDAVVITANHVMSCALIKVAPGNGFTEASLADAQVSVRLNGLQTQATIDLATGTATPQGEASSVSPWETDGAYKALVVPQTVAEGNLITITIDGRDYNLRRGFTFVGGRRHTFTVTVSRTSSGINVNIGAWDEDETDQGGIAE